MESMISVIYQILMIPRMCLKMMPSQTRGELYVNLNFKVFHDFVELSTRLIKMYKYLLNFNMKLPNFFNLN